LWMGLNNPQLSPDMLHIGIIGVPYDGSVTHERGCAAAPDMIRKLSLDTRPHTENLISLKNLKLKDLGDVAVDNNNAEITQNEIAKTISPVVEAGAIPMIIGGDHSITGAVMKTFRDRATMGLLWIDAHADLMDTYKGIKGREESKWNHACVLRRIIELSNITPENVLIIGLRDYIPEEIQFIRENNIAVIYSRDLVKMSPETVVDKINTKFEHIPDVYISFDIDILDPAFAPGTGAPIPGGISTRFLYDIIFSLFDKEKEAVRLSSRRILRIAGFDIVEIAPRLDNGRMTSLAGMGIITSMLGVLSLQLGVLDLDL